MISNLVGSKEYLERSRRNAVDFTRNRKMPFEKLIYFMLNMVKSSIQVALDRFFEMVDQENIVNMSQSSFSQARLKLKPEAIQELQETIAIELYKHNYNTWHGYKVFAIDGSKIQLPDDKKLRNYFGTTGCGNTATTGQASILYDTLNDMIVTGEIEPMSVGERKLAERNIEKLVKMGIKKALILFDRGYASLNLMKDIDLKGIKFIMRLRSKFNTDIDKMGLGIHNYVLGQGDKKVNLRIIKFLLPTGEIEVLATNLLEENVGIDEFKYIYFKRWSVETKYGVAKMKLELENFSGRTEIAIRQDFYVALTLANIAAVAKNELQPKIDTKYKDSKNKHEYQINTNQVIGTLKDRFICVLLETDPKLREKRLTRIIYLIKKDLVPVRPNRSLPRNPNPRRARFRFNQKSNC